MSVYSLWSRYQKWNLAQHTVMNNRTKQKISRPFAFYRWICLYCWLCVLYFNIVIQLHIEVQHIFPVFLGTIKHLLCYRYKAHSGVELFANIRKGWKTLTIFVNSFLFVDVLLDSKYASKMCFFPIIFNKIDYRDYWQHVTIRNFVCRIRLFLLTRLYEIQCFQSFS